MAGTNLNSPSELNAFLETVRQRQQIGANWPADYLFHPVDNGNLTVGIRNDQGQVENYSVWLKRDEAGGAFNSFILLNTQAQFDALYRSRPGADQANTVTTADTKAWVNPNTGDVRPANVTEVAYLPGSGKIVPEDQRLDYFWSETGEAVDIFEAERMIARHESQIRNKQIPADSKITAAGKGELVRPQRALIDSNLVADGVVSQSDLATDLRSQGYVYDFPATLVQTPDSQKKAAAEQTLLTAFDNSRTALGTNSSANTTPAAVTGLQNVSIYQPASAVVAAPVQAAPQTVLSAADLMAQIQILGTITTERVDAAKDDKDQMRAASRAISDINQMLMSDPKAENAATQARILEALRASPGQSDIIADFARKKIADPSVALNEYLGMTTGRMLGMRPALGSVEPIGGEFARQASPDSGGSAPKNLADLEILPTGTDLADDYNRADEVLGYIRASAIQSEPQDNKLTPAQTQEVIAAWRQAGYESYARVMEDMVSKVAGGDPLTVYAQSKAALSIAYNTQYEQRERIDVQGDLQRGQQQALEHLNVDYGDVRNRIPEVLREHYANMTPEMVVQQAIENLEKQGQTVTPEMRRQIEQSVAENLPKLKSGNVSDEQKDAIMDGVRGAVDSIAQGFNTLTPERMRQIEETINTRISQAIVAEMSSRLGNVDERINKAREDAQTEYDDRTRAFIERVNALPPEQKAKLCENSGSNPLVQAACKPQ